MKLSLNIKEAIANLYTSKLRSTLAILGILVGTASVVAMVASAKLATQAALSQFKTLGTKLISVSLNSNNTSQQNSSASNQWSLADMLNMPQSIPNLAAVAPYTNTYASLSYQGKTFKDNNVIIGSVSELQHVIKISLAQGRFISNLDEYNDFCVIGSQIAQQLQSWGVTQPIGKLLHVGNNIFTIIGVAKPWPENSFFYEDINQALIIPIKSSMKMNAYANVRNMVIGLNKHTNIETVKNKITQYILKHANNYKLFFRSPQQIIARMEKQSRIFTLMLGLIGSISLFVGGIGVMNIMLVSVTERKREIGIRMAVGAQRHHIRSLFLIESATLALLGGISGVIFGELTSFIIANIAHWHFKFFLLPPAIGFIVSVAIGIFFGFYPAHRASKLDPIECLRAE